MLISCLTSYIKSNTILPCQNDAAETACDSKWRRFAQRFYPYFMCGTLNCPCIPDWAVVGGSELGVTIWKKRANEISFDFITQGIFRFIFQFSKITLCFGDRLRTSQKSLSARFCYQQFIGHSPRYTRRRFNTPRKWQFNIYLDKIISIDVFNESADIFRGLLKAKVKNWQTYIDWGRGRLIGGCILCWIQFELSSRLSACWFDCCTIAPYSEWLFPGTVLVIPNKWRKKVTTYIQ